MEITITRALAELKLLDSRINNAIHGSQFIVANKKSAAKVNGISTKDEFIAKAKASIQSIEQLIENKKAIKSAIVASNAITEVTIAGVKMTVAEAIERKSAIEYEKTLLLVMEQQLRSAQAKYETEQARVQQGLENQLTAVLGSKDQRSNIGQETIDAVSVPYLRLNEWELINPLKIDEKIAELRKQVEDFEHEVDFVLSESNTITKIVIPD